MLNLVTAGKEPFLIECHDERVSALGDVEIPRLDQYNRLKQRVE